MPDLLEFEEPIGELLKEIEALATLAPGEERDWLGKLVNVRVTETYAWHVIGEVQ